MNSDALAHNNKIYTDPKDTMVRLHVNHAHNVKARHHTTNMHHQRSARASTRTASKKGDARYFLLLTFPGSVKHCDTSTKLMFVAPSGDDRWMRSLPYGPSQVRGVHIEEVRLLVSHCRKSHGWKCQVSQKNAYCYVDLYFRLWIPGPNSQL